MTWGGLHNDYLPLNFFLEFSGDNFLGKKFGRIWGVVYRSEIDPTLDFGDFSSYVFPDERGFTSDENNVSDDL